MCDKPLIYIACPYAHRDILIQKERFKQVSKFAGMLAYAGNIVYSPISHSAPMQYENKRKDGYSFWRTMDEFYLLRSDVMMVLMLDGWEESEGVAQEMIFANEHGKPIIYIPQSMGGLECPF